MPQVQSQKVAMKQLNIIDIADAFADEPSSIGDRLAILGVDGKTARRYFAKELLETSVYGVSFLKFFQDNIGKFGYTDGIPPDKLPENYVNPYEDAPKMIGQRLSEIGMTDEDKSGLFDRDTLNLSVSGGEFTDFIVKNQKKLLGKIEQLALKEGSQNAAKS